MLLFVYGVDLYPAENLKVLDSAPSVYLLCLSFLAHVSLLYFYRWFD